LLELPADLAIGIFAGALTSTPALAAATEGLKDTASGISIGYGIAYPFGVISVVLFVQLLPRILKHDLEAIAKESETGNEADGSVVEVLVKITNKQLNGKRIADSNINAYNACQISRIYKEGQLVPLHYDDVFHQGQLLLLIGRSREIEIVIDYLGQRSDQQVSKDTENERQNLLLTNRKLSGKSISDIAPLKNHGVVITRITRSGIMFVPNTTTLIQTHDILTTVGQAESLRDFAKAIGHRDNEIDSTDLLSLSAGLTLGIVAGLIPLGLPGGTPVTLGLAGGPLIVALLLGHFGKVGRIVGHIPRPTRVLLQDLGLVFFLASAGVKGGGELWDTVQIHGVTLLVLGMLISSVPMIVAWPLARKYFKLDPLQTLGGICGGMTSTPALGAITAKTDSQVPVISYVSAYPVALIVIILVAKVLIGILI
jgi:putative transport protein